MNTRAIVTIVIWVSTLSVNAAYAQESSHEVAQLRERIKVLEDLVQQLVQKQNEPTVRYQPATLTLPADPPAPSIPPRAEPAPAAPFRSTYVRELLPDIGKIGAEIGLLGGGSFNPFELNEGVFGAGYIDLPLRRAPGGKLSYEILVGLSESRSRFETSSQVAVVANLAAGASLNAALAGTPDAPFPVKQLTRTRLRLLEVSPVLFKYTVTSMDRYRFRPYLVGGAGVFITITNQNPVRDASALFSGQAPFGGPLIAGQISQAPELTARGVPQGQGNLDFGLTAGGGAEFRLSKLISWGLDYRFHKIAGTNGRFQTVGSKLGFHF